jgi:hypothetical protein
LFSISCGFVAGEAEPFIQPDLLRKPVNSNVHHVFQRSQQVRGRHNEIDVRFNLLGR